MLSSNFDNLLVVGIVEQLSLHRTAEQGIFTKIYCVEFKLKEGQTIQKIRSWLSVAHKVIHLYWFWEINVFFKGKCLRSRSLLGSWTIHSAVPWRQLRADLQHTSTKNNPSQIVKYSGIFKRFLCNLTTKLWPAQPRKFEWSCKEIQWLQYIRRIKTCTGPTKNYIFVVLNLSSSGMANFLLASYQKVQIWGKMSLLLQNLCFRHCLSFPTKTTVFAWTIIICPFIWLLNLKMIVIYCCGTIKTKWS